MPSSPSIIIVTVDKETDNPFIELVNEYFQHVNISSDLQSVCQLLLEPKAKLFVFMGNTMAITLASYYRCLNAVSKQAYCEHKVLCAIPRKYEHEALQAYQDDVIDDYLVCRPIFEKARIIQVIQEKLFELKHKDLSNYALASFLQSSTHYPDELKKVLSSGIAIRHAKNNVCRFLADDVNSQLQTALAALNTEGANEANQLREAESTDKTEQEISIQAESLLQCLLLNNKQLDREFSEEIKQQTVELLAHLIDQRGSHRGAKEALPVNESPLDTSGHNAIDSMDAKQIDDVLKKFEQQAKILIVEDDMISLQLTKKLLSKRNVKVESAPSGQRAINMLRQVDYDLVLMDINLPDNSGVFVVEQIILDNGKNANTPFIMLTGNKSKNMVDEAIKRGAKGYLVKPLKKTTIDKIFERFNLSKS